MHNQFTLHCIAWMAGAPLIKEVRAAACKAGLMGPAEAQQDELDERCRHALAISKDGYAIACARLTPSGKVERMAVFPGAQCMQIESALTELLSDYARESVPSDQKIAASLKRSQQLRKAA